MSHDFAPKDTKKDMDPALSSMGLSENAAELVKGQVDAPGGLEACYVDLDNQINLNAEIGREVPEGPDMAVSEDRLRNCGMSSDDYMRFRTMGSGSEKGATLTVTPGDIPEDVPAELQNDWLRLAEEAVTAGLIGRGNGSAFNRATKEVPAQLIGAKNPDESDTMVAVKKVVFKGEGGDWRQLIFVRTYDNNAVPTSLSFISE